MDTLIIFAGKYLIYLIILIGAGYLFFVRDIKRFALFAAVSLALAYALGWVAGHLWYNARPFAVDGTLPLIAHVPNNGFPSDHMLLGAAIAAIVFAYNRTLGVILGVLALVVGFARVAAGIHHWADIAGSIAIAAVVVWAVEYALRAWSSRQV
jgi:undecaprenyl-diphosphatase